VNDAAIAVLAGAAMAIVLLSLVRRTRRLVMGIALAAALVVIWSRLRS
jgi:hypothetical protein